MNRTASLAALGTVLIAGILTGCSRGPAVVALPALAVPTQAAPTPTQATTGPAQPTAVPPTVVTVPVPQEAPRTVYVPAPKAHAPRTVYVPVPKAPTVASNTCDYAREIKLRRGDSGPSVARLQCMLNQSPAQTFVYVDGVFGANTDQAVRIFQQCAGIYVDGIVGSATWGKLNSPETVHEHMYC